MENVAAVTTTTKTIVMTIVTVTTFTTITEEPQRCWQQGHYNNNSNSSSRKVAAPTKKTTVMLTTTLKATKAAAKMTNNNDKQPWQHNVNNKMNPTQIRLSLRNLLCLFLPKPFNSCLFFSSSNAKNLLTRLPAMSENRSLVRWRLDTTSCLN